MEAPQISAQQESRLAGQKWECANNGTTKSGADMAETVRSLGTHSFAIERLEHSRVGEQVQVGPMYWRRIE